LAVWWSAVTNGDGTSTAGRPAASSSKLVLDPDRHTTRSAAASEVGMSSSYSTAW
jgi:hypothetical protein